MCGIVGVVAAHGKARPDPSLVGTAVEALRHRGPDGKGVYSSGRAVLGHTRLSIIDVHGGAQPLFSEDGSVATVFNGEIWNHVALRTELEREGHVFRTRCDTEVLVHGYEQWGLELPEHLDGMFAFAVWDDRTGNLLLARDRVGKKPLYLRQTTNGIAFGSDARSILLATGCDPEVDPEGVAAFLFQRYSVTPRTLFNGIERLEAGSVLTYDGYESCRRAYWALEPGTPEPLAPQELRELLRDAVGKRLIADVPVGVLLSGGVDSSAVLGLAREAGASRLDTFTIGFTDPLYDERPLARMAARKHQSIHHEVVVDSASFLEALPRLAWYRDEPIAEPSEIPLFLLADFAAQRVKVVLGGDGGDELFGGYPKYRAERLLRLRGPIPMRLLAAAVGVAGRRPSHRRLTRAVETLGISDDLTRWASWFRSFTIDEVGALLAPAIAEAAAPERLLGPLRGHLAQYAGLDPGRAMLLGDFHTYLQDNMLARADKVLMAASVEGRVPLLDSGLVDRLTRTRLGDRMSWRRGKTLLRAAVADLVPTAIARAPKRGFPVPVVRLLMLDGGEGLRGILLSDRALSRGLLRPDAVRALVDGAVPVAQRDLKLFTLLSLELWLRANVDAVTTEPPRTLEELAHAERPVSAGAAPRVAYT